MMSLISPEVTPGMIAGPPRTPDAFLGAVCAVCKVSPEEIKSPLRSRELARFRQMLMYLLKVDGNLHEGEIANFLNRNRTTVINGVKVVRRQLENGDTVLASQLDKIRTYAASPPPPPPVEQPRVHIELYGQKLCAFKRLPTSRDGLQFVRRALRRGAITCQICESRALSLIS
jgi:hypothetical protein